MARRLVLMKIQLSCDTVHFKAACLRYYKEAQAPVQTHLRTELLNLTQQLVLYFIMHLRSNFHMYATSLKAAAAV